MFSNLSIANQFVNLLREQSISVGDVQAFIQKNGQDLSEWLNFVHPALSLDKFKAVIADITRDITPLLSNVSTVFY